MTLEYSFKLFANQYLFSGSVQGPSFPFITSHGAWTAYQRARRQIAAREEQLPLSLGLALVMGGLSPHRSGGAKGFKASARTGFADS